MRVLGVTVSRGLAGVADNIAAYLDAVAAAESFDDGLVSPGVWLELLLESLFDIGKYPIVQWDENCFRGAWESIDPRSHP